MEDERILYANPAVMAIFGCETMEQLHRADAVSNILNEYIEQAVLLTPFGSLQVAVVIHPADLPVPANNAVLYFFPFIVK